MYFFTHYISYAYNNLFIIQSQCISFEAIINQLLLNQRQLIISSQRDQTMFKKQYEESLKYLVKTFNIFIHQATNYFNMYASSHNKYLNELVSIWAHPKGILNLITNITVEYQTELPYPQAFGLPQNVIVAKPSAPFYTQEKKQTINTLQKSEPKSKISKKIKKNQQKSRNSSSQIYEGDQSEEDDMKNEQSQFQASQFSFSQDNKKYKRGPYKNYTTEEKIQAVELYQKQQLSITELSKQLGIPCKNIKRWATEGVSRKIGGGRRRTNPLLEQQVYKWLVNEYAFGQSISMDLMQEYALSLSQDPHFKASRGWAIKFIQRYKLREEYNIV